MINDILLNEIAADIQGKISRFGITETVFNPDPTDTTLSGELTGRTTMTNSRVNNAVTFTGIRSGASVIDTTNGDDWKGIGMFDASTSGDLESSISTTGILQTTSFDVEVKLIITPQRS